VAAGGAWLDRSLAAVAEDPGATQAAAPVFNEASAVSFASCWKASNKEIAWRLQISESWKAILQSLFQKIKADGANWCASPWEHDDQPWQHRISRPAKLY
jgi:hypothetical protein